MGRMITENKLTPTVRNLFRYRVDSFFDENISSLGILPSICEALHRYELFDYFESRFLNATFPNYSSWKTIVKNKINKYEENAWNEYALSHPNLDIARACFENVPPRMFSGYCRYLSGPGCPSTCSSLTDGQLRFERWDPLVGGNRWFSLLHLQRKQRNTLSFHF